MAKRVERLTIATRSRVPPVIARAQNPDWSIRKNLLTPFVLAVAVLVMGVREVLVAVAQRLVLMLVGMRLNAIPSLRVLMLMVRIVYVSVGMPKRLMSVHVHVLFRNVQVHADYHQ